MALNPDALNLNYDSDNSMQVDSDSDHPVEQPSSIPPPDPDLDADADADADPDADAEGDAEYVDDTTSAILENPVAGPSTYSHKHYVSLLLSSHSVLILDTLSKDAEDSVSRPFRLYILIGLDRISSSRVTKTAPKTRMTRTMLPMQMTSMARRKPLERRRRRALRSRLLPGQKVGVSSCIFLVLTDDHSKQPYAMLHQIQTQIMVPDRRKRRGLACLGTRYVSRVGETRFRIITKIIKTLRCSRRRRLLRHIMSTHRSLKKTMKSRPS